MPRLLALLALSLLTLPSLAADKYWVFFGTYTGKDSKGIYRSEFDSATGKLGTPELAAEVGSPSFLHIAPDGKTLYAVGEAAGKDGGGVYSWKLDPATGKLSDQVSLTSKGAGPCHISTDAKNEFAVVSNYGGGSATLFKLKPDGSLDSRTGFIQHEGKVFDAKRQGGPHGHCGFFDATGSLVMVCDLGLDKVMLHKLNRETGAITPHDPAFIKMPDRSGPRHIHIAPSNDMAFVNGEIDMTVSVVKLDVKGNKFEVVQTVSTLPEGEKVVPAFSTAECRIHPSGKFVYVSNRGYDTVAAFAFDQEKMKLTQVGQIRGDIKTPRNFNISPDGKWMLIASQASNKVGVYAIDEKTGMAKETDVSVKVGGPVCIKFLAKP
ncbi:MAG: lactonase family protein [Fimbriiglobus sp.]|jgi:6-phosphogluconolactonase|nr:lactonase family protein [Fimbriiglobus sp.]